jgi:hypothetical protein
MVEFLFEVVIGLFGEGLLDVIAHLAGESKRGWRRLMLILAFAALGAIVGALSLLLFPVHFIRGEGARLAYLAIAPLIAGATFALVGRRRERKGKRVVRLESFWPAFTFALAMALVRYFGAE